MPFGTRVTIDRSRAGWTEEMPLRLGISVDEVKWIADESLVHPLGIGPFVAGEYGWLIP